MFMCGGEGGIRTHVPVTRQDAFEAPPLRPLRYLSVWVACSVADLLLYARSAQPRSRAALAEEPLQNLAAFLVAHAGDDLELVVVAGQFAAAHG
jgi:hypothetical protein